MNWKNRRKSSRATVNLMAAETTGGKYYIPLLANLSDKGVYVESPAGLERPWAHHRILELFLPGMRDRIWARCRVVRHESRGFFQGEALQFVDISAHDRCQIRTYLQRCMGYA